MVKATSILCDCYTQSRYIPAINDWPPYHPKHYTPLTIVHHRGRCTESEVVVFPQKFKTPTEIVTDVHYKTASIEELFAPLEESTFGPHMFLIEGAPGIGKTIFCKELYFNGLIKMF